MTRAATMIKSQSAGRHLTTTDWARRRKAARHALVRADPVASPPALIEPVKLGADVLARHDVADLVRRQRWPRLAAADAPGLRDQPVTLGVVVR